MVEALSDDVDFDELERRLNDLLPLESAPVWRVGAYRDSRAEHREARDLREEHDCRHRDAAALQAADEVARTPGDAGAQGQGDC